MLEKLLDQFHRLSGMTSLLASHYSICALEVTIADQRDPPTARDAAGRRLVAAGGLWYHRPVRNDPEWLFDLDNTLYPPENGLFGAVDARINEFLATHLGVSGPAADELRRRYHDQYGITLVGLMEEHGTEPHHYLDFVHHVPVGGLSRPGPGAAGADRRVARPPFDLHERLAPARAGGDRGSRPRGALRGDFRHRRARFPAQAGPGDLPHGARAARRRTVPGDPSRRSGAQPRAGPGDRHAHGARRAGGAVAGRRLLHQDDPGPAVDPPALLA